MAGKSSSKRSRSNRADAGETAAASARRHSLEAISGFVADDKGGDFHKLLNDRVRLGMLSSLAVSERLSFSELKKLLAVTDGNLSVHARKLEDAGYVGCEKTFEGRVPKTEYQITRDGRMALERYLKHMEALIRATSEKS
ncbi:MAG: transcriptional regulator [Gammaproteobacteria bacterium]|jgi:DNA-binding HxlR family transcriptional regulator|nr:MAG: transcriptional regulator [Gammaproteobacteria bacterium]